MEMRQSRVLEKLRSGAVVSCVKVNTCDARIVEIAAMMGFDCIWSDMEHVPNDWSAVEKQIYAAKAHNADLMVRVSRGSYSDYLRPLEMDAAGIMVPHVMSFYDARAVVRMTRFHPAGRRPVDGGNADGAYCNIDLRQYMEEANRKRFVVVQIEDPEPLEEVDAIASLDGIDMLFFGPGDFSQGIGAPGVWDHPMIDMARKRVAEAARSAGKFAGTVGKVEDIEQLASIGYSFINIGSDVTGISSYFNRLASEFSKKSCKPGAVIY